MSAARTGVARRADRALLLRRVPYGNTSLIVHVLTPAHGRRELMAKGAHRPKNRLCGVLDWFDTLELEWTEARERPGMAPRAPELGQVRAGALLTRRRGLTRDIGAYRAAQSMTEMMEVATRFGAAEPESFALLTEGYDALDARADGAVAGAPEAILAAFDLALADLLGLSPALDRCAVCGEPAPPVEERGGAPRAAFSAALGGRLCRGDATEAHARGVRVGTLPAWLLELAASLHRRPLAAAPAAYARAPGGPPPTGADDAPRRMLDFTGRFLDRHLESRQKSRARFLASPDRNRAPR